MSESRDRFNLVIRYSMLQAWLQCPIDFHKKYILGRIEIQKSSALEFGTAMHLGIKTLLEGDDGIEAFKMYWNSVKPSKENLPTHSILYMRYYQHSWSDLLELGEHFLNNFEKRHKKKFSDFEQEVAMEMSFPVFQSGEVHTLQGTADLVGLYEGKLTVVDWKTSSKPYPKNKILLNYQMYIYAKLYQHKTGKLPEQIMYKVFNKKDGQINTVKHTLTESYLDSIFKCIEYTTRAMLRNIDNQELYHGAECHCERV